MQVLLQLLNRFLAYGFLFYRNQLLFEDVGGSFVNLRIYGRILQVIFQAFVVVFERIAVFIENKPVKQRGIGNAPGRPVVGNPLVGKQHFGCDPREFLLGNHPRALGARGKREHKRECGQCVSYCGFHRSSAPKSFLKLSRILFMMRSTSSSVRVRSLSRSTKLMAYCFLPNGILSPR